MRGLDTYIGRPVTNFQTDSDGNWFIELVGGVRVISSDPEFTAPDFSSIDPTTLVFIAVIFGESQTQMSLARTSEGVIIDEWRATFNPTNYQIYDPGQQDKAWTPQVPQAPVEIPPYPAERVVDGPQLEGKQTLDSAEQEAPEPPQGDAEGSSNEGEQTSTEQSKSQAKKSSSKKSTKKRSSK